MLRQMTDAEARMKPPGDEEITILVTPVWNDAARLEGFGRQLADELARRESDIVWIIADDGSGADQGEALCSLRDCFAQVYPQVRLHLAAEHHGKGSVVREAWALEPQAEWFTFVDADGAVTAEEMLDLIEMARQSGRSSLAIRKNTDSTRVHEGLLRSIVHHGFLGICRLLLGVKSEDTQCGAKVIRGDDYRKVVEFLKEPGLAFDAELLAELSAVGVKWDEIPVNWTGIEGSKVKPLRDGWAMLVALLRIRRRQRQRLD